MECDTDVTMINLETNEKVGEISLMSRFSDNHEQLSDQLHNNPDINCLTKVADDLFDYYGKVVDRYRDPFVMKVQRIPLPDLGKITEIDPQQPIWNYVCIPHSPNTRWYSIRTHTRDINTRYIEVSKDNYEDLLSSGKLKPVS